MPDSPETFHFIADKGDARSRLDRILVRHVQDVSRFSRNVARQWIESGIVAVDGRPTVRASTRVPEGARVAIQIPASATRRTRPAAEDVALNVLYEDETMLVIDKPPGVVVHPSYKQLSGTILNAVLWRTRSNEAARPGIVTRLDKDTSGLVLVALSPNAHAILQRDARAGELRKEYLACVTTCPRPPIGRITLPIGRDPHDRRRMVVAADGAASETRYEVIAGSGSITLVACTLITGRTHQIRVHMAASGWPLVGDRVYGPVDIVNGPPATSAASTFAVRAAADKSQLRRPGEGGPQSAIARQALHAWRISMRHPVTREPLAFESPLPPDMRALLERSANNAQFTIQNSQVTSILGL
jgi:23S rRNA pseudouridine1911/1915/1917 synthase